MMRGLGIFNLPLGEYMKVNTEETSSMAKGGLVGNTTMDHSLMK
jgi:hypothetical protein